MTTSEMKLCPVRYWAMDEDSFEYGESCWYRLYWVCRRRKKRMRNLILQFMTENGTEKTYPTYVRRETLEDEMPECRKRFDEIYRQKTALLLDATLPVHEIKEVDKNELAENS